MVSVLEESIYIKLPLQGSDDLNVDIRFKSQNSVSFSCRHQLVLLTSYISQSLTCLSVGPVINFYFFLFLTTPYFVLNVRH